MTEQKLIKRKRKAELDVNRCALADASLDLAEFYYERKLYETAIHEYNIASNIYKSQSGREMDYARTNRRIGEAFVYLQEYGKALDCQQIYLDIAKKNGDKLEEQRALATMGHIYLTRYADDEVGSDKTSLNLAYKTFLKSFVICEQLENVINKYEHKDMMSRLLGNLGVVLENLGDYDKGINLLLKSINICKSHDLYEQLQRSYTCLASLYCSKGDYNNAIQQYNAAMEVAGRLKDKVALKYECLKSKSDILIKLCDFLGAKSVLLKAYKLKRFPSDDDLQNKLKVVAAICYTEDTLLMTSDTDYKTKKQLYEKLGDGACILCNYSIATEYYKKMLEAAINNEESGLDLSPCYISLAETFRDNKQFGLAIEYFKKDYELTSANPKDRIKTLLNIADCMEASGSDITDIQKIYETARNQSIEIGDNNIQYRVINRQITMLRDKGFSNQATQLENSLMDLNIEPSSDSEPMDELTTNVGNDISIKDITDVSSDSDAENNEDVKKPRTSRRRSKGFQIKKNPKGETQLHLACIAGNVELVRRLLEQGHTVNIRDNCGWLPIHEACICGHLEIVEMLIGKGAWINDKGGKLCDGITPLHDAASNGHLDIVQILLDKGASAIAKTNSGVMPLQMLQQWHETNELPTDRSHLYEIVTTRLMQDMQKLGHSQEKIMDIKGCGALVSEDSATETSVQPIRRTTEKNKTIVGKLRRNISCDTDLDKNRILSDDSDVNNEDMSCDDLLVSSRQLTGETNAKIVYKKVIENLRHPLREGNLEKKRKSSDNFQSAIVDASDIVDDWLEDDMPVKNKKHKNSIKRQSSGSLSRHSSSHSLKSNKSDYENNEEPLECDIEEEFINFTNEAEGGNSSVKKRKIQTSLIDQGFTRHHSYSTPSNLSAGVSINVTKRIHQTKITTFGENRSPDCVPLADPLYAFSSQHTNAYNSEPTLSLDVRIDGKLYRVPVLASEIHSRTIHWLAEEAADRYSRKEGVRPTLELETKNGALLDEGDFLNILFNLGNMQAEEVQAKVVKWNLSSLEDRYTEAALSLGVDIKPTVLRILQVTSTSLNLSGMGLGHRHITPLCKAINRQINLHSLNLCDNFMRDSSLQLLCLSLPSLDNLSELNLSNNELTVCGLKFFADMFAQSSKRLLTNLVSLNLSHNSLGNESLRSLAILTQNLNLQVLHLADVGFSHEIFEHVSNRNVDLCLNYITNINISYNKLNKQQLVMFLSWINPVHCEELNISNNNVTERGLLKDVVHWIKSRGMETFKLKSINLSRCKVIDVEVDELLRLAPYLSFLKNMNLSYNELTSSTLVALLSFPGSVNLVGCDNLLNCEDFYIKEDCSINVKELTLSCTDMQYKHKGRFIDMLKNCYPDRVKFEDFNHYLKVLLI